MTIKTNIEMSREDAIAEYIIDELNKGQKEKVAYNLEEDDALSSVKYWIPTGSPVLDIILSNRKNGGLPSGRFILLTGLESSGKSLLAAHALANVQKMGGIAVFIDSENAVSKEFLRVIGVNLKTLVYVQTQDIAKVFDTIETVIKSSIEKKAKVPIMVVVDSITSTTLPAYIDMGTEVIGYEGAKKAAFIANQFQKMTNKIAADNVCVLITAQLRVRMNAMANQDPYDVTGGMALKFYPSIHIRIKKRAKEKISSSDEPVGVWIEMETLKNRLAPERRKAVCLVRYDRGIDYDGSILKEAFTLKLITGKASKIYITKDGEELKFTNRTYKKIITDEIMKEILDRIADIRIHKYKEDASQDDIETVTISEEDV